MQLIRRLCRSFTVIPWAIGNFSNLALFVVPSGEGPKSSQLARHGTYLTAGFFFLTLAGEVVYGFSTGFPFERQAVIKRFFNCFFAIVLPIRFVWTVIWLGTLSLTEHTQLQKFFALSCLLEPLLAGNLLVDKITSDIPILETQHEKDLAAPKNGKRQRKHAKGYISDAKAAAIVEARIRRYGPYMHSSSGIEPMVTDDSEQSAFMYAPREGCESTIEPSTTMIPGFLRCACCLDSLNTPSKTESGDDIKSTRSDVDSDRWYEQRRLFLRKPPVGAVFNYVPGTQTRQDTNDVHSLCEVCERSCFRILQHLERTGSGSFNSLLNSLLNPKSDVCSIEHHDNVFELQRKSATCHLCALIWGSLNDSQQDSILRASVELSESHRQGRSCSYDSVRASQGSIRLVTFDCILIPHFGGFNRPRRWEKSVPGHPKLAISEFGSEFARPLYLTVPGDGQTNDRLARRHTKRDYGRHAGPVLLPMSDNTGSKTVINLLSHILKPRYDYAAKLPTRILDVSDFTAGRIRLRHSMDLDPESPTRYIALSHCWGLINMPKLLADNIDSYMDGIEIAQLPKTFREAIEVTFRLGIEYIWIDSLCIIQDDKADWKCEAALMAYIYSNAFCTIAAVDAADGTGGLFRSQNPRQSNPCLIGISEMPIYAVPHAQSNDTTLRSDLALSKWNSRGWCLQERYLSQAIVYFCATQIYVGLGDQLQVESEEEDEGEWEAPPWQADLDVSRDPQSIGLREETGSFAEDLNLLSAQRMARVGSPRRQNYVLKGQLELENFWHAELHKADLADHTHSIRTSVVRQRLGTNATVDESSIWWAIVNEYTMRDLTNPSDKLPAIRGLAVHLYDQYLRTEAEAQYVMGLWTNKMAVGLLWYVDLGSDRKRPQTYRAPSWSWASVEGIISNDSLDINQEKSALEIVELQIQTDEIRPQPWLQDECDEGSAIILRGSITAGICSQAVSEAEKRYYVARRLVRHDRDDMKASSALQDLFSPVSTNPSVGPLCLALHSPITGQRVGWMLPDSREPLPSEVFCLKIHVEPTTTEDPQATWAIRGLVLAKVKRRLQNASGPNPGALYYRRIGYFELDCEFKGTGVGREYSHTKEVASRHRNLRVDQYVEYPIMQEPVMDPFGFFENVEPEVLVLV